MYCSNCGAKTEEEISFCGGCGKKTKKEKLTTEQDICNTTCDFCGENRPTKYNEFYANIGMLFQRKQMCIKGNLCKKCTNKYFWKYTFTNLFLGWWGVISFWATFIFIIHNTLRYLMTLTLKNK